MIYKNKGIMYSQFILDSLGNNLEKDLKIGVNTFYNCREQGYCLDVFNSDYTKSMRIWIYAQRNSDKPTITYQNGAFLTEAGNSFDEESWRERTTSYDDIAEASYELVKLIKEKMESE